MTEETIEYGNTKREIFKKLLAITEEAQTIPKNGYNSFSNYKYVKAVDALGAIRKLLIKHGVHLSISENTCKRYRDGKNFHTEIECTATFINTEDPQDRHSTRFFSVSADTLDKDIFKAKTNGLKYLFTQEFKLVTDDFVDTEQGDGSEQPEPISAETIEKINNLIEETSTDKDKLMIYLTNKYGTPKVEELSAIDADQVLTTLKAKKGAKNA